MARPQQRLAFGVLAVAGVLLYLRATTTHGGTSEIVSAAATAAMVRPAARSSKIRGVAAQGARLRTSMNDTIAVAPKAAEDAASVCASLRSLPLANRVRGTLLYERAGTHASDQHSMAGAAELVRAFACRSGTYGSNPSELWACMRARQEDGAEQYFWTKIAGSGCGVPVMSKKDRQLLIDTYAKATHIFEWGAGGSTRVAAHVHGQTHLLRSIVSVESDRAWAAASNLAGLVPGLDATMIYVDLKARPNKWGAPGPDASPNQMRLYPDQLLLHPREDFDVVFVDGRFRVACAAAFVLKRLPPNAVLLVHDWPRRTHYHVIEKSFPLERITIGNELIMFRKRQNITDDELAAVRQQYEHYQTVWA